MDGKEGVFFTDDMSFVLMDIGVSWICFGKIRRRFCCPLNRGSSSMKESGGFLCICYFFAQKVAILSTHQF